jgi:hypothetical protein
MLILGHGCVSVRRPRTPTLMGVKRRTHPRKRLRFSKNGVWNQVIPEAIGESGRRNRGVSIRPRGVRRLRFRFLYIVSKYKTYHKTATNTKTKKKKWEKKQKLNQKSNKPAPAQSGKRKL